MSSRGAIIGDNDQDWCRNLGNMPRIRLKNTSIFGIEELERQVFMCKFGELVATTETFLGRGTCQGAPRRLSGTKLERCLKTGPSLGYRFAMSKNKSPMNVKTRY